MAQSMEPIPSLPVLAKREEVLEYTLKHFDLSPAAYPFDEQRIRKIEHRREQLEGQLFFDYMLDQAGIAQPAKVFPPKSVKVFKYLVEEILNSEWPSLDDYSQETVKSHVRVKRTCLIYYLLAWWGTERSGSYADDQRLSNQFAELTYAYFNLDNGNAVAATSLLCSPSITQSVTHKIFQALSIATDGDPSELILRYARMAKPPLNSTDLVKTYLTALAKINFVDAWAYQRGEDREARDMLLASILKAILSPRPIRKALHILTALPLQHYEREFIHRWALEPPTSVSESALAHLHSLLTLRLTQEGDYTSAVQLNRQFHQYGEKLKSEKKRTPRVAHDPDASLEPGMIVSKKAEEWREILREAVALLPIEHRRVLESKINESDVSIGMFPGLQSTVPEPVPAENNNGMDMSWDSIVIVEPVGHSTPPPSAPSVSTSAINQAILSTLVTPAASPMKKTSRVAKSSPIGLPIETQTVGRQSATSTPRRPGAMSYLTPLKTPSVAQKANASLEVEDLARSGAPPPSTIRASSRNAFFDPNVRTIRGPIFSQETPKTLPIPLGAGFRSRKVSGDVEMLDATADETEPAEEEDGNQGDVTDDSFVIAPQPHPRMTGRLSGGGAGGLLSASGIVQIKKAQERQREREEREREAKEREKERQAQRERELALKKAKYIEQRRSLGGGGSESSFGATSTSAGKRKRDGDDNMGRDDEERENASSEAGGGGGGRGKRKSESGMAQVVHKPVPSPQNLAGVAPFAVSVPAPEPTKAATTSQRASLAPSTSSVAARSNAAAAAEEVTTDSSVAPPRRSSRVPHLTNSAAGSTAGGSQVGGSVRGPSPTPETADESEEEEEGDAHESPRMPGAFVHDDEEAGDSGSVRRTRARAKASQTATTATKSPSKTKSTRAKPDSKTKKSSTPSVASSSPVSSTPNPIPSATAPAPATSATTAQARQTRGKRTTGSGTVSVPQPIAEDAVLEAVEEEEGTSPRKASARAKKAAATATGSGAAAAAAAATSTVPALTSRRSTRNTVLTPASSMVDTTEAETDDAGDTAANRRTSRRLNALAAAQGEGSVAGSSTAGGKKAGRKA